MITLARGLACIPLGAISGLLAGQLWFWILCFIQWDMTPAQPGSARYLSAVWNDPDSPWQYLIMIGLCCYTCVGVAALVAPLREKATFAFLLSLVLFGCAIWFVISAPNGGWLFKVLIVVACLVGSIGATTHLESAFPTSSTGRRGIDLQ